MPNEEKPVVLLNSKEFPSNSNRAKGERPKAKKLATAKRIKKPFHKRFANAFLAGEPAREVGDYVLYDVVIPAAKSTIADLIEGAIDLLLFGGTRSYRGRPGGIVRDRGRSHIPYNSMHERGMGVPGSRGRNSRSPYVEQNRVRSHDFTDLVFASRAEAELILAELDETIIKYGAVSVHDFLDMVDMSTSYTDQKWGWTDLVGASVIRIREGWIIDLPKPIVID